MTTDLVPAPLDPVERKRLTNARFGRKKRAKARAAKLCQNCPLGRRRSARPGKSTCEDCAARQRKAQRQSRRERLAAKLCVDCGLVPFTAGTLCADCDARRRARPSYGRNATRQRRREERLCRGGCGRSAYRTLCCAECTAIEAEKAQVRRAERIAQGLCYRCGRHPAPANKGCPTCVEGDGVLSCPEVS